MVALDDAVAGLWQTLQASNGQLLEYRTGEYTWDVYGVRGSTVSDFEDVGGLTSTVQTVDWLVKSSELEIDGFFHWPAVGDTIEAAGKVYQVQPLESGQEPWRWVDSGRILVRIHTKDYEDVL